MSAKHTAVACPHAADVHAAFTSREPQRVAAHLRECDPCAAEWASLERAIKAAQQSPPLRLGDTEKDQLRNQLLVGARAITNEGQARRSVSSPLRAAAGGGGLLLLAAALVAVHAWPATSSSDGRPTATATAERPEAPLHRATIHEQGHARFTLVSPQPDETVRLYDGTLAIDVSPLRPGERFRVITDDNEVEVYGTVFTIAATEGRLARVTVERGRVQVRAVSGATEVFTPGETWLAPTGADTPTTLIDTAHAPLASTEEPQRTMPNAAPSRRGAKPRHTAAKRQSKRASESAAMSQRPPSAAEIAFQDGWAALRSGDPTTASRRFAAVALDAPLGQDAAFWRGVALARAGRSAEAVRALELFLAQFPTAAHRDETQLILGTLLHSMGENVAAKERLHEAQSSSRSDIRERARRELAAPSGTAVHIGPGSSELPPEKKHGGSEAVSPVGNH